MLKIKIINIGLEEYEITFKKMINFIKNRNKNTNDQLWIVEHYPVFTLGINSNIKNIINSHNIKIIKTDRGGEITYHAPGQIVIYILLDICRNNTKKYFLYKFIKNIEQSIICTLEKYNIQGKKSKKRGIYIKCGKWKNSKIAFLGLKIKNNCYTYHGISLNVNMNLKPFKYINPCGYKKLKIVDMKIFNPKISIENVKQSLVKNLINYLIKI